MKKALTLLLIALGVNLHAQSGVGGPTSKKTWFIEANTGLGDAHPSFTGLSLRSADGVTSYSVGGEVGYFLLEHFAIKAGVGYADNGLDEDLEIETISYKIGAKYYINERFAFQTDVNAAQLTNPKRKPTYLGLQAGYAFFLYDVLSIEPGLRYDISINQDFSSDNVFQFAVGFVVFLK
ncbi:hypothetical protein [Gangjinia marincola]